MKYFILFICALLSACGTTVQERIVVKTQTEIVKIPDSLLVKCEVTPPPQREVFVATTGKDRERLLTDYSIDLIKDLRLCNVQIDKIRTVQKEQIKTIESLKESK